jgi:hypothetical protein
MNATHMEARPYKDAAFCVHRWLLDAGAQAAPEVAEAAVQACNF